MEYSQQRCAPYSSTFLQSPTFWCPFTVNGSPPLFLLSSSLWLAEETRSSSACVIFGRRVLQGPYWPRVSADHSGPSCHQGAASHVPVLAGSVHAVIAPVEVLGNGFSIGCRFFWGGIYTSSDDVTLST